jgi:hypothetical protein
VYTGLKRKIANPVDFEKNLKAPEVFDNNDLDISIPIEETTQHQNTLVNVTQRQMNVS